MSKIVKITALPDVLIVRVEGEFELEEAKRNVVGIVASIDEHDSDKILIDGRGVSGNPTLIERFYYGEFVAEVVRQRRERSIEEKSHRFAYLLHEPTLDPLRFGETVMVNRGVTMKAVDNLDEAAKWLGLELKEIDEFG
jgi:hypothetical protein